VATGPSVEALLHRPGTVLLDDRHVGRRAGTTYLFSSPSDIIAAARPGEVLPALQRLDRCLADGAFAAGFIGYEAGMALDKPIRPRRPGPLPLLWLGVYGRCRELDSETLDLGPAGSPDDISPAQLNVSRPEYLRQVRAIKEHIAAGDVYQVNYTCKLLFQHAAPAPVLFARLRAAHPVGFSGFVNVGPTQIVSLSPELFMRREGSRLVTRPMKGTIRRGRWPEEDAELARRLAGDEKNRAENVMIVDLMRNDIGRIASAGGVSVPSLFDVEPYETLFQMTSTVEGRLREGTPASRVIQATFPPGSVTGAPKIRAMEIIREAERAARGVYCGAVGFFGPGGDMLLNVAIRTIAQTGTRCELGVGSGIVADSVPESELEETLLKAAFLRASRVAFDLYETLLWRPGTGYLYLEEHLARLAGSARYFGRPYPGEAAREALSQAAGGTGELRVRLILDAGGRCRAEGRAPDPPPGAPVDLLLASRRVDPADRYLYHKTSLRAEREADLRAARERGCFESLYLNVDGQITEGAFTNLLVELPGGRFTPPIQCGLLPGVWRGDLLARGEATERVLTVTDLRAATRVWVGNSVRGAVEVGRVLDAAGRALWRRERA
jgi:para-aminobenzoate synthetase / 4-amino-4-deoxychorismate lyase